MKGKGISKKTETTPVKSVKKQIPTVKKDCEVNVGRVFKLVSGEPLPKEIDERFYSSFKTEGII